MKTLLSIFKNYKKIKIMKKLAYYLAATTSVFFIVSCSDDDNTLDNEKPTIVINEPTANEIFHAGEEIHVDVDFTDNVALASYKIDIHYGGDGHTHSIKAEDHDHGIQWNYETTGTISGTTANVHLHIDVPADVLEGPYHFGVFAIDAAGNEHVVWTSIELHEDHDDHSH